MKSIKYGRAYKEIIEIIRCLPKKELKLIPKTKLKFYIEHQDENYVFNYDCNKSLKEQNVSRTAQAIIVTLFRDYFATERQKTILQNILKSTYNKKQEIYKRKYSTENLYKRRKTYNNINNNILVEETSGTALIEYKESFIKTILNKIKSIFNR